MAVISGLESKIIRQIEYYFGDHNLSRDKFMQEEIKKDEGWMALSVMLKFNRLAQITKDEDAIAGAVAKSTSGLVEVHEDKSKIRRNPERKVPQWDSNWKDDVQSRTLYVKGFPEKAVLDDIMPFVDKVCLSENVFMRRLRDGSFKGSIFVTYKSVDDCKKVMEMDSKKFKEDDAEDLIVKFQKDYQAGKVQESKEKKANNKSKESEVRNEVKQFREKGAVLKIQSPDVEGISYGVIKAAFAEKVEKGVAWVSLNKDENTVKVRFHGQNSAVEVIKNLEGKITIEGNELELKPLEGDEEDKYWEEFDRDSSKRSAGGGRGGRGGRGGGRGGRGGRGGGWGGNNKRNRDNDDESGKKRRKPSGEATAEKGDDVRKEVTVEKVEKVEKDNKRSACDDHEDETATKKRKPSGEAAEGKVDAKTEEKA